MMCVCVYVCVCYYGDLVTKGGSAVKWMDLDPSHTVYGVLYFILPCYLWRSWCIKAAIVHNSGNKVTTLDIFFLYYYTVFPAL